MLMKKIARPQTHGLDNGKSKTTENAKMKRQNNSLTIEHHWMSLRESLSVKRLTFM